MNKKHKKERKRYKKGHLDGHVYLEPVAGLSDETLREIANDLIPRLIEDRPVFEGFNTKGTEAEVNWKSEFDRVQQELSKDKVEIDQLKEALSAAWKSVEWERKQLAELQRRSETWRKYKQALRDLRIALATGVFDDSTYKEELDIVLNAEHHVL